MIENVIFSSASLLVPNCEGHWCAHCHDTTTSDMAGDGYYITPHGDEIHQDDNLLYNIDEPSCLWKDGELVWDRFWVFSVDNI